MRVKRLKIVLIWLWEARLVILAGLTALLGGMAASACWESFDDWRSGAAGALDPWRVAIVALFFAALLFLYFKGRYFFRPRTRFLEDLEGDAVGQRRALVLFLSPLSRPETCVDGVPGWLELTGDLGRDLDTMQKLKRSDPDRRWNWEMPLRAIYHHSRGGGGGRLRAVVLICSNHPHSVGAAHHFVGVCRRCSQLEKVQFFAYQNRRPYLHPVGNRPLSPDSGVDFFTFEDQSLAAWRVMKMLKRKKINESDIVIDFTGGTAVSSVVAAAMTFNREAGAQYVSTKDGEIKGYDIVLAASEAAEKAIE